MTVRRIAAAWLSLGANLLTIGILRIMGPRALRWSWLRRWIEGMEAKRRP